MKTLHTRPSFEVVAACAAYQALLAYFLAHHSRPKSLCQFPRSAS